MHLISQVGREAKNYALFQFHSYCITVIFPRDSQMIGARPVLSVRVWELFQERTGWLVNRDSAGSFITSGFTPTPPGGAACLSLPHTPPSVRDSGDSTPSYTVHFLPDLTVSPCFSCWASTLTLMTIHTKLYIYLVCCVFSHH